MSKIAVHAGGIIDSMRITYQAENAPTPITVQHGGLGGSEVLSFDIGGSIFYFLAPFFVHLRNYITSDDEKLVAVYGTRLLNPSPWKEKQCVTLIWLYHSLKSNFCFIIQLYPVVIHSRQILRGRPND